MCKSDRLVKLAPSMLLLFAVTAAGANLPLPDKIEFNRDVRPILSENCFKCHGHDPKAREADRRLDTREGALAEHEGVRGIVPGDLAASEVHLRIHTADKEEQMPPPKSGKVLTARQVAILDKWIEQGAAYQPHWAYIVPTRPAVPEASDPAFVKNPIDALVLARQRELGLEHAAEADRLTLIRRLSFDLTGLPPTPQEVDAFVSDPAPDACERLVERLLRTPEYGERMAVHWLDLVRYADTIGFHSDNPRNVWPYRDYVISAFNENKPFDQFTIEQLAGDLLPGATRSQKVASAFNRLNLTTQEGGAQAKDYESRTVADRVRAIGTVWLAQTTGCAQCHDHKYDPITARDFYRLGAFFADLKESAIGAREDGMLVTSPEQEATLKETDARIAELKTTLATATPALAEAQADWEKPLIAQLAQEPPWTPLHPEQFESEHGAAFTVEAGEIIRAETAKGTDKEVFRVLAKTGLTGLTGFRLEALKSGKLPKQGPGRSKTGNFVLSEFSVAFTDPIGLEHSVGLSAASATFEQKGFPASAAIDGIAGQKQNGWAITGKIGEDSAIYFELAEPLPAGNTGTLVVTLRHDFGADHTLGKFRLAATASPGPIRAPANREIPGPVLDALRIEPARRTPPQAEEIAKYYRSITPLLAEARTQLADAEKQRKEFYEALPKCLVSDSMPTPRVVRIQPRGDWQNESGEIVQPGVPAFLPQPAVEGRGLTRLDLAQWLVARENPLTARVFVNRLWKLYFGTGLSKVLDDLGAQGEPPPNAALLDWLACEFVDSGWNVKQLVRLIVTSGTYRQSSQGSGELQQRDPYNRELARQSRFRLEAEFVRDNALAISGLLVRKVGGPSAKPYQPAGYWENLNFPTREWEADNDSNQWRRGLYTWWQRSYLQPSLAAFDAPSREECVAERSRSNIPQQALALLNDPTYVEAARVFATRILRECPGDTPQRLTWAFRQALGRPPRADELETTSDLLHKHLTEYEAAADAAQQLVKTGLTPLPTDLPTPELAAWTNVARVILNLHETITRF
ncbi:MAG: hypothetical protein QOE70_2682 [Chthoniobacter sp.]|jgi:cytochrome c553|nr:hypothetical protein [Chthoniobacter sp.]